MLEKIQQILREYKDDETVVVTESTTFEELELDSLDTVELVMTMETEFECTLSVESRLNNVGELMALINSSK